MNAVLSYKSLRKPHGLSPIGEVTERHGRFSAEPFQKGFGVTIGNALRRVLISSIEGSAVTGVKINDVENEFTNITGVKEDLVDVVMNIKELAVHSEASDQRRVFIEKKGASCVTAADIRGDPNVQPLNPDQHILTITDPDTEIYMELFVERGFGYQPSEDMDDKFDDLQVIAVDAVFTPIKKVNYWIENVRIGDADYDRLILDVLTDGSVRPDDAIAYAAKIIKDFFTLYTSFIDEPAELPPVEPPKDDGEIIALLDKSIEELELSVRATNCLKNTNIKTLRELCSKTDAEMLKTKNFGRKSLEEIKKVLAELGLRLGFETAEPQKEMDS
ncbi:MAG: DNA-directed RNA polymerase subunit alpha [Deferribacteraceae bacterium]|jgi:DNA-directed RNA polymerase subunit alpha|nr:DNA-directed RNA polymerase subunit alpha [Deferribacteraceae bacterium]